MLVRFFSQALLIAAAAAPEQGHSSSSSPEIQAVLRPARFAALEAQLAQPRPAPAQSNPFSAQRARLTPYNAFFSRFWWLEDRAAYLDQYQGPIGSWTR